MEIKTLYILIENSYLSNSDRIILLGAMQELQQYRENPLANIHPCWKYVRENNISRQLIHVMAEVKEAEDAKKIDDIYLECFDILQASITLMYILQVKYGVNLTELVQRGIIKNTEREGGSYYE